MLVRDFMTTHLTTLQENESLLDATLIFARSSLRHIPILKTTKLAGIVTERELKHYTPSILSGIPPVEYNRLMESTPLSKIMTRSPSGRTVPCRKPRKCSTTGAWGACWWSKTAN